MSRTNAPTFLHLWFYQQERRQRQPDCQCHACSKDREVPGTAQGQCLASCHLSIAVQTSGGWGGLQRTDILENKDGTCWWSYMTHHRLVPGGGGRILNLLSGLPSRLVGGRVEVLPREGVPSIGKDILDLMMHCWVLRSLYECIQTHFPIVKLGTFSSLPWNNQTY